jgi:hypothetical protein
MKDRRLGIEEIELARAGWPLPELIGGALVGAMIGLSLVTFSRFLDPIVPNVAGLAAGALIGAGLSWIHRPRRIELRRDRLVPEQQHLRRAA